MRRVALGLAVANTAAILLGYGVLPLLAVAGVDALGAAVLLGRIGLWLLPVSLVALLIGLGGAGRTKGGPSGQEEPPSVT